MTVQVSLLIARLAALAATAGAPPGDSDWQDAPALHSDRMRVLDEKQFARLRATMSDADFCYFLHCHLLDVEFHLEEIARARIARDFPRLSRKALALAAMTADVGAPRASMAARRLDAACRTGSRRDITRLIGELGHDCTESEMELRRFLAYRAQLAGAA